MRPEGESMLKCEPSSSGSTGLCRGHSSVPRNVLTCCKHAMPPAPVFDLFVVLYAQIHRLLIAWGAHHAVLLNIVAEGLAEKEAHAWSSVRMC